MHEMAIAQNIIEIAEEYAVKSAALKVNEIELDIGKLAGIELESLLFAIDVIKEGTICNSAKMIINHVEAQFNCTECLSTFNTENYYAKCPVCNSHKVEIIAGREMRVKSIDIN
ncbi:MAG: hydrogenase maturation nickel metallochaperone HypA [Melioribacteraceae bacterium]|nr:hydrogenase maturation nickel metallochaperone HypA [Melioribacteraceae bacterium]MCF8264599.1 hydrogenase maturation nickel metallochaperone HypA [Melioribacteraceae bacterium]